MNITATDKNEISLTTSFMASFASARVKSPLEFHEVPIGQGEAHRVKLRHAVSRNAQKFIVTAEPYIIEGPSGYTVEKIRKVKKLTSMTGPLSDSRLLAEGFAEAYLVCCIYRQDSASLRITIVGDNASKSYEFDLSFSYLKTVFDALMSRCEPFALVRGNFELRGYDDIKNMPFPYSTMRDGQRDLINRVYKAIKNKDRLLAAAPTGIGKTVSTVFPAVKALGAGLCDKIFYLTAKTVTGKNALDAMRSIKCHVPDIRCVSIVAKERCCPSNDKKNPFKIDKCSYMCPRLADSSEGEYTERRNRALEVLLDSGRIYEIEDIKKVAEAYCLCPYELSLDLSEYCQVIVCDYNYVFDTRVRFRRYFNEGNLRYVLLADEAHNLPDRSREIYNSELTEEPFKQLIEAVKKFMPHESSLLTNAENILGQFEIIKEMCLENTEIHGGDRYGYFIENSLPRGFIKPFTALFTDVRRVIPKCDNEEILPLLERIQDVVGDLIHTSQFFGDGFVFFGETKGEKVSFRIMCLDPSQILDSFMDGAVSSILFSATLTPMDYFADILGCKHADMLELESPYDSENLCIAAVDTVATRLSARESTALDIAEIILTTVNAKEGNYLVYFPSYKYMQAVVKQFLAIAPKDIRCAMQKTDMSLAARERFLSFFEENAGGTLVGFCVLGGVFAEGIDLAAEKLIGAVLVGVGLPGLSSELNILKDYYDRTREDGYNFAYVYPGIIKILQAAGRVIRGENDRGVVVLIDERYADPTIRKILPPHWKHMKYVGNTLSLNKLLSEFWKKQ